MACVSIAHCRFQQSLGDEEDSTGRIGSGHSLGLHQQDDVDPPLQKARVQTKSLGGKQVGKLHKTENHSKNKRSKLKAQIKSPRSELKNEKEGNQKLEVEMKTMAVQHEDNGIKA